MLDNFLMPTLRAFHLSEIPCKLRIFDDIIINQMISKIGGRMNKQHFPRLAILALVIVAITASTNAEVPNTINYQGRLTDDAGQPITGPKLLKFKIYGSPSGDDSLWSSAFRAVQVDDGLFNIQLGSFVSFPEDLFIGNDPRYLGITVDTDAEINPRTQFITVPYAFHADKADTSDYALGGPGAGAWVDDGNVVRLATSSDRVGIGTSAPSERLVVGKDIGFYGLRYIISGSYYLDDVCGYKMGYSSDHQTTLQWDGDGAPFAVHTREGGVDYQNTLVSQSGNIGIGTTSPSALLSVGDDLGSAWTSNFITVGEADPTKYTGICFGENNDNRGWIGYDNEDDFVYLGTKEHGTYYNQAICFKERHVGIGGISDPSGELCVAGSGNASVQLGNNAICDVEVLDEPGIARVDRTEQSNILSGEWTTLCERGCTFPTSGYAVILATCEYESEIDNTHVIFGISDSTGLPPHIYSHFREEVSDFSGESWIAFTIHEVFTVSAGYQVFSFRAYRYGMGGVHPADASMTVMFFPTAYGTVDAVASAGGDEPMMTSSVQPMLFTSNDKAPMRATESEITEVNAKVDRLKTENNELKAQMTRLTSLVESILTQQDGNNGDGSAIAGEISK